MTTAVQPRLGGSLALLAPLPVAVVLFVGSVAALGGALLFEHVGGLAPCPLCVWQRIPYWLTIPLSALAVVVAAGCWPMPRWLPAALISACGAAFTIGGGIALHHVGVEQGWWAGSAACVGTATGAQTLEEMRAAILAAPLVRCDEIPWQMFGVSIAGLNLIASAALAALSFVAAGRWLWCRVP